LRHFQAVADAAQAWSITFLSPKPWGRARVARWSSKSWRAFRPGAAVAAEPAESVPATRARAAESAVVVPVLAARAAVAARCRILGIDPGSRHTGYGIVDCSGSELRCVVHGRIQVAGVPLAERMHRIHDGIRALLARFAPDEIAVERVFVNRNVDSALKLGQARGAALAALGAGAEVFEYAPRAVKLATVGFGGADKAQVAHMVRQLLGLGADVALATDASDALAVALCHAHARRVAVFTASTAGSRRAGAGRR
jgi:crossover junction endodeoxyribonuclease RuvC